MRHRESLINHLTRSHELSTTPDKDNREARRHTSKKSAPSDCERAARRRKQSVSRNGLKEREQLNAPNQPRAQARYMKELLTASRLHWVVMTASKQRRELPEFHAAAFRRHNAGIERRAQEIEDKKLADCASAPMTCSVAPSKRTCLSDKPPCPKP